MYEKSRYGEYIQEIIKWFKIDFLGPDGFPVFDLDGRTGKPLSKRNLMPELGDYLPFLLYLGEEDYVNEQIELARIYFEENELLINKEKRKLVIKTNEGYNIRKSALLPSFSYSFAYTDLLLGLLECYELKGDRKNLSLAEKIIQKVFDNFFRDGFLCSYYIPLLGYRIPVSESNTGLYIEILVDLYRFTDKQKYIKRAEDLAKSWLKTDFVKSYGLFPYYHLLDSKFLLIPSIKQMSKTVTLTKHNYCTLAGMLALYEKTKKEVFKEAIEKWVEGFEKYLIDEKSIVHTEVEIDNGKITRKGASFNSLFITDFFCDIYCKLNEEKCLLYAKKVADFWLKLQSKNTGLIPNQLDKRATFIDNETDFSVALMKLYSLTGEKKYKNTATNIVNGVIRFHRIKRGYVRSVDAESGEIVDYKIETKFTSLFLKPLIAIASGNEIDIYKNQMLYNLLRDR